MVYRRHPTCHPEGRRRLHSVPRTDRERGGRIALCHYGLLRCKSLSGRESGPSNGRIPSTRGAHPFLGVEGHHGLRSEPRRAGLLQPCRPGRRPVPGRRRRHVLPLVSGERFLLLSGGDAPPPGTRQGERVLRVSRQGVRQLFLPGARHQRLVRDHQAELLRLLYGHLGKDVRNRAFLGPEGRGRLPLRHGGTGPGLLHEVAHRPHQGRIPADDLHRRGVREGEIPDVC